MQPSKAVSTTPISVINPVWLVFSSFIENMLIRIIFVTYHLESQRSCSGNPQFSLTSVHPSLWYQIGLTDMRSRSSHPCPGILSGFPLPKNPTSLAWNQSLQQLGLHLPCCWSMSSSFQTRKSCCSPSTSLHTCLPQLGMCSSALPDKPSSFFLAQLTCHHLHKTSQILP